MTIIATAPILRSIDREATHPITTRFPVPIPGLPACPAWCAGDCVGGGTEHLGNGITIPADRLHEKTVAQLVAVDGDSHESAVMTVDVRLFVERYDTVDPDEEPIRTRVLVEFIHATVKDAIRVSLTPTMLRELAAGAVEVAELLEVADAAEGR